MTQRIGQWICNELRKGHSGLNESHVIAQRLWNLTDKEFNEILKAKEKAEYKPLEICTKHHRVLDERKHCRDCDSK